MSDEEDRGEIIDKVDAKWCSVGPDADGGYEIQDDDTGEVIAVALDESVASRILADHSASRDPKK